MRAPTWKDVLSPSLLQRAAVPFVLVALVAAVMAATSGTGAGTATLRSQPTSVVFTVVATFLGLTVVALLVALVAVFAGFRPSRADEAPGEPRRHRLTAAAVVVSVVALVVFLLFRLRRHALQSDRRAGTAFTGPPKGGSSTIHFVPAASFATLGVVVAAVVALVVVPVLWRARGRRSGRLRGLPGVAPSDQATAALGTRGALSASLARVRLPGPSEEADPRRAVVAAYVQMAEAADEAGAPRAAGETAEEFLDRLLASLGVARAPAERLTAVFELARYSDEPVGEPERRAALAALDEIRADLAGRTPAGART